MTLRSAQGSGFSEFDTVVCSCIGDTRVHIALLFDFAHVSRNHLLGKFALADFQNLDAGIEIMCSKVRIAHCHLQSLMTEPHLHTSYIYTAANEARRTSMAQNMWNNLIISTKADFDFRIIPYLTESHLIEHGEGTFQPLMRNFSGLSCSFSKWNGAAAV